MQSFTNEEIKTIINEFDMWQSGGVLPDNSFIRKSVNAAHGYNNPNFGLHATAFCMLAFAKFTRENIK